MQNTIHTRNNQPPGELAWRLILIGVMALLMCSCRAPGLFKSSTLLEPARPATADGEIPRRQDMGPVVVSISSNLPATPLPGAVQQVAYQHPVQNPSAAPPTLPRSAYTGEPPAGVDIPHLNSGGIPYPDNWRPPGIVGSWPADEYIYQGGDREQTVNVAQDWSIDNLDSEDAIVHYHTLEGELVVQPTNQISIYAPRFGSVRRMDNLVEFDNRVKLAGVDLPTSLGHRNSAQSIDGILQQMQPQHNLVVRSSSSYRDNTLGIDLHNQEGVLSDVNVMKQEQSRHKEQLVDLDNSEKPRLGQSVTSAGQRVIKQFAEETVEEVLANEKTSISGLEKVHVYHMPKGKNRLEVNKTSSSHSARPGDTIEFTIEFKNVGTQDVGNVTIVDHLTSRLEYVAESQQSSLEADFFVQESVQEGTTVLRWEILDPVARGESGQVTFTCRVR
jgi:uncharacterized repeat protein (TIGR01451 family)